MDSQPLGSGGEPALILVKHLILAHAVLKYILSNYSKVLAMRHCARNSDAQADKPNQQSQINHVHVS